MFLWLKLKNVPLLRLHEATSGSGVLAENQQPVQEDFPLKVTFPLRDAWCRVFSPKIVGYHDINFVLCQPDWLYKLPTFNLHLLYCSGISLNHVESSCFMGKWEGSLQSPDTVWHVATISTIRAWQCSPSLHSLLTLRWIIRNESTNMCSTSKCIHSFGEQQNCSGSVQDHWRVVPSTGDFATNSR